MKFVKYNQPRTSETEIKCHPRLFRLTVFYRGLKHELVKDFSGRARLLSSWIINKWLNKRSIKIANSSYFSSLYQFVELLKVNRTTHAGTEFRGALSKLEKKIQIRACVFVFSVKLEKWSFHVDLTRPGKKSTEIKKLHERRAKPLFLFIKYTKFVVLSLSSRPRSNTPYS